MRRNILFPTVFLLFVTIFSSCDEGRIYEKEVVVTQEGRTMKLIGKISGIRNWASGYDVVVAGFEDKDEYSVISKSLPASADGIDLTMTLSGIPENVTTLKLCVVNRLRKSVADFQVLTKEEMNATTDTIVMNVGTVDVGMFNTVQTQVFDRRCIGCHGDNGRAARGLFLTKGQSYSHLVEVPSSIDGNYFLVKPGDVENSYIHLVLNKEGYDGHGHLDILSGEPDMLTLIDDWINNGAQE